MCGDEAYSTVGLLLRFNRFDAVEAELTNCFMTVRFSGGSVSALLTGEVIEFRPKTIIDIQGFHG